MAYGRRRLRMKLSYGYVPISPRLRVDPTGSMRVKMNIALRRRALSPVRLAFFEA